MCDPLVIPRYFGEHHQVLARSSRLYFKLRAISIQ